MNSLNCCPRRLAILSLCFALLCALLQSHSAQAQTLRSLSEVLEDRQGLAWSEIQNLAATQGRTDGPLYSSAPTAAPSYETFEGDFMPQSANTKLAIFSDDGCNVKIDGVTVHSRKGQGQALPDLTQSLYKIPFNFVAGRTYRIRVEYSNMYYVGTSDIDGATLFAYSEAASTPTPTPDFAYEYSGSDYTGNSDMATRGSSVPIVRSPNEIQASAGDPIGFRAEFQDSLDRKRPITSPASVWQNIYGGEGPWRIKLTVSGYATWNSPTGTSSLSFDGLKSGNCTLYVGTAWATAGYPKITITATVNDYARDHSKDVPSGLGSTRDSAASVSWIVVKRGPYIPKKEQCIEGPLGISTDMVFFGPGFVHRADPNNETDDPPVGTPRPYYNNQLVFEDVSSTVALFNNSDVNPAWRTTVPNGTTLSAAQIASIYFVPSHNSFVLGSWTEDTFKDNFGSYWLPSQTAIFTDAALAEGVSIQNHQTYKAAGRSLGDYTLKIQGIKINGSFKNYITRTQG